MRPLCARRCGGRTVAVSERLRAATRDSTRLLIAVNLIPVLGVLFLDWEIFPLILLYWLENVMLGVLQVVRIVLAPVEAGVPRLAAQAGKLFLIPFFTVHYGIFCLVHGVFVFVLFAGDGPLGREPDFPTPGVLMREMSAHHLWIPALALFASHAFSLLRHLAAGEAAVQVGPKMMGEVYGRIIVLHVAILFGGFAVMLLGSSLIPLLLLIALKTGIDLKAHQAKHERAASSAEPAA